MTSVAMSTSTSVLQVEGLRVGIEGQAIDIVTEVDLDVAPGEVLGLVGESGSGKSTLSLALLGYARPGAVIKSGRVMISDLDLLALGAEDLRRSRGQLISYVPQDPASSLNPALRIGTQLMEILETHDYGDGTGARRDRIAELLDEIRLPSDRAFLKRYPHQLSGGQQQRVVLAMAFACRPRVVVLDEPTTGLDVTTQAHVLRTVGQLCDDHKTAAIYVTHDLAVINAVAHRTAVMYAGRLVEVGPTSELISSSAHPYTRRLVEAIPDPKMRRDLKGIPGRVAPLGSRPSGCVFASRCDFVELECRTEEPQLVPITSRHDARCRRMDLVRSLPSAVRDLGTYEVGGKSEAATCICVTNLRARHGTHEVLHGVDLAVQRGKCLALVGESGSGKTTLARCIAGLHTHGTGDMHLFGAHLPFGVARRPIDIRRRVQYVFQNPYSSLNPRQSIGELLAQPLRIFANASRRERTERVTELLEQVSLDGAFARRYPAQLSGGERQRVAIARALAVDPELLVCDEVTSALDVSVQASVVQLLARLQGETGLTLLFVTHNLGLVRAVADTVAVLDRGRIVEHGETVTVLDNPQDEYTRSLLTDSPTLAA